MCSARNGGVMDEIYSCPASAHDAAVSDADTVGVLCLIAMLVAPLVAAVIAIRTTRPGASPAAAWLRGFLVTWLLGVALATAAGFMIDMVYLFHARGAYMIPAFLMVGIFEVVLGGIVGVIVGYICRR